MGQVEGPFVTYRYGHVVSQKCLQYIFLCWNLQLFRKLLQDFQYIQTNFETTYNEFFDQYFIVVNQNNSSFAIISFFHQFLNLRFHFTTVFTMFIYPSFLLRKMHTSIIIIIIIIIIIKKPSVNETHSFNSLAFGFRVNYEGFNGVNR